uniref:Uncharacterized protein n=1 Tax=Anguilla anguilla TaxID=7936 RepID=A0A0E9VBQ3_ANGAN
MGSTSSTFSIRVYGFCMEIFSLFKKIYIFYINCSSSTNSFSCLLI